MQKKDRNNFLNDYKKKKRFICNYCVISNSENIYLFCFLQNLNDFYVLYENNYIFKYLVK